MTRPRVSYALLCYQQEKFVRDAVRSALAQDLEPLEIILSDDCSSDGTYAILEEEARAYRGPNTVTLNRNAENLGIAHNGKVVELAKGDLVIIAHGDDVAVPHRARRLAEAWKANKVSVLSSNVWVMDADGKPTGLLSGETESRPITVDEIIEYNWKKTMLGATLAIGREIFLEFGPIDPRIIPVGTDHVFPFRGALLHGAYYVAEPLLYWRQHAANTGDLIGDKTGSELVFYETNTGYRVMTLMAMNHDLTGLLKREPKAEIPKKVQHALVTQIGVQLIQWIGLRNQLYLEEMRPTWIDKKDLAAKPIRQDLRAWPVVRTTDIPDPGESGKRR